MSKSTKTVIGFCTALLIIGLAYGLTAGKRAQEACVQNLQRIGNAIRDYQADEQNDGRFPAAFTGTPPRSWRVSLLPYLDEDELFDQYDSTQPWNSVHNKLLIDKRPIVFGCPLLHDQTHTAYQAIVGVQTAWPHDRQLREEDVIDGISRTVQLVERHHDSIVWTSPNDIRYQEFFRNSEKGVHSQKWSHMLLFDGTVRGLSPPQRNGDAEYELYWRTIITPNGGQPFGNMSSWGSEVLKEDFGHAASSKTFAESISSDDLGRTDVLPYPTAEIVAGKNMVYCPTFAIAWRQLERGLNSQKQSKFVDELRKVKFAKEDISPSGMKLSVSRNSIHCILNKELPFQSKFEALPSPLEFHAAETTEAEAVSSFGVIEGGKEWESALQQVKILEFESPDNFIIQITNLTGDDLILAKMQRPETIADGILQINQRIETAQVPDDGKTAVDGEEIVVPILEINLCADFLEDLQDDTTGLESAKQRIQFRLDENGARLIADAEFINFDDFPTVGTRKFIFDKPFMLLLRESANKQPYFATWIANSELMQSK